MLRNYKKENAQLQEVLARTTNISTAQAERIRELNAQLKASKAHALEQFNARSELEAVVDELRAELKEAQEREENQRDRHREALKEREALECQVHNARINLTELDATLGKVQNERDDLELRLQSACEAMVSNEKWALEKQEEANQLRESLQLCESGRIMLQEELEAAQAARSKAESQLAKLNEKLQAVEAARVLMQGDLDTAAAENRQLREALAGAFEDAKTWELRAKGATKAYEDTVKDLAGVRVESFQAHKHQGPCIIVDGELFLSLVKRAIERD